MENKKLCLDTMRRIEDKLKEAGYNIKILKNAKYTDILCKGYRSNIISSKSLRSTYNCALSRTNCNISADSDCPYQNGCTDIGNCPLHNNNANNNSSNKNGSDSLFRIRPTDTYNGIFLHAIKLNGETCDLKITFNPDTVDEVIETINYLI